MTLRFTLLGFEISRIELDIEREQQPTVSSVVDEGIKLVSKHWIKRLFS